MMRRWICLTLIPAVLLAGDTGTEAQRRAAARILFTNNSNGKLVDCNCRNDPYGGLAERVGLVREYRAEYPEALVLDSGGYFGLSNPKVKGNLILNLMDLMGYDMVGIGDQELYNGLGNFLESYGWYRDRIVNASIRDLEGELVFTPYKIVHRGGINIGVTGIVSKETFKFFPAERIDFTVEEPDSVMARILPELKRSCDYIVVLSQMGVDCDKEIAARWTDIDLIIGGHSQTLIEKPIRTGETRIVQTGKGGGRVGEIVLGFGESNTNESFKYKLFEISDRYTILPEIQTLLDDAVTAQEP